MGLLEGSGVSWCKSVSIFSTDKTSFDWGSWCSSIWLLGKDCSPEIDSVWDRALEVEVCIDGFVSFRVDLTTVLLEDKLSFLLTERGESKEVFEGKLPDETFFKNNFLRSENNWKLLNNLKSEND